MEDRLLHRAEVAVFLNISQSKIYELLGSGALPSVRIDRTRLVRPTSLRRLASARRLSPHSSSTLDQVVRTVPGKRATHVY